MRRHENSTICALPVCDCNLVFRLDRISHRLRVQFQIKRGSYDLLVNELCRVETETQRMRELLVGKWIKDEINNKDTWLLVVAVEMNTENVASVKKRYSSKRQEIFGAKVTKLFQLHISSTYYSLLLSFNQAVAFGISQVALQNALPPGVELNGVPNNLGSLLDPVVYRDIKISCMYLPQDIIDDMLVPEDEVPPYVEAVVDKSVFSHMFSPKGTSTSSFKPERKSDFSTGSYESSIKKIRKAPEHHIAHAKFKAMMGAEGDEDEFFHKETMYILRCLDTSCSVSSLFAGLEHYPSWIINGILKDDFRYRGDEVLRSKQNLILVCESFLNAYSTLPILNMTV